MDFRIFLLLFASIFGFLVTGTTDQPGCEEWKNVSDHVRRLEPFNFTCNIYQPCTGIECRGIMNLDGSNENVHFAMSILCSDPLKLEVVIDISKYPAFNLTLNISKNQPISSTSPLPGLRRVTDQGSIDGTFTIVISSPSASHTLVISAEVSVTVKVMGQEATVQNFVIIPNVTVPIPTCSSPTSPSTLVETKNLANEVTAALTDDSCSPSSLKKPCEGEHRACNEAGKCICLTGYIWSDESKKCDAPISKGRGVDPWIIVAGVIATVIVVAAFVVFLVHRYRRNRDRYGQHTLLINNDNDTELDDPDPPMLTG